MKGEVQKDVCPFVPTIEMKIQEGKRYTCKKNFALQGNEINEGDLIGINVVEWPIVYCSAYQMSISAETKEIYLEINYARLEPLLEFDSEEINYGICEECDCLLDSLPCGGWGVGYVCASCAKQLRGEYE